MARSKNNWWTNALQNKMILIVLMMMVVIPFIATPLDTKSAGMAALACESFGIALLVCMMWRKRPDLSKESIVTFIKTGANLPALVFLGVVAVSLAMSPYFHYSVQEALRLSTGIVIYFVAAYQFRRSEHIAKAVDILVYVAIGVSAVAFAQYGLSNSDNHYATGMFGDHQLLGSFLMLLLPFVCISAITESVSNKQLIAQIASVMTIVALLLAQARSAWLGTAAGVVVLGLITLWTATRRSRLVRRKHELVMPAMLLVVSLAFFFLVSPEAGNIGDRMQSTTDTHDSAMAYRAQLATGALEMIKARPIAGQGVGLYSMYQARYTGSGMSVWRMHDMNGNFARPGMGETAHDLYLQTAAELGIPGLIVFLCIPAFFLVGGFRKVGHMDSGIRRSVLLASIASVVAFTVDAAASPSWQYGQLSVFFWLILGMGVGSLRPRNKHYAATRDIEEAEELTHASPALGFMRGAGLAIGIALAIVMVPSLVYAYPPLYLIPQSAQISPKTATIVSFQSQPYDLLVTFTDGETFDVTTEAPETVFTVSAGAQGTLTGANNSVYQAALGPETVMITGSFTQQGVTVSDTATLTVDRRG